MMMAGSLSARLTKYNLLISLLEKMGFKDKNKSSSYIHLTKNK